MRWQDINETELREVIFSEPSAAHVFIEEGADKHALIPAAVLFPIVNRKDNLSVLFTKRTSTLKDHPGQISFPGGRVEPEDHSLSNTALREAREEIDPPSSQVEVIGYLPEYHTVTGYCITPVMGLVTPPFTLRPDPAEVEEVFEVPLSFLLDPANHQRHHVDYKDGRRQFYAMPYNGHFIWGATAGMIVSLSKRLSSFVDV